MSTGRRLYLGRLPPDTRPEDVEKHFDGYGKINECRVMTGFGFVEFDNPKDADDVVYNFNGKSFLGQSSIIVEFAKDARRRDDRGYPPREAPRVVRRPNGIRINVTGISRDTSWQDLKDFGREAGSVSYADVDRDNPGRGVLEYPTPEDADNAVRILDGRDLRGVSVRLTLDDGPRDRRSPPPRRERSRSPDRRGGYRDEPRRRSRSPPPRRDYDRRDDRDYDRRRYAEVPPRRDDDRDVYVRR